MVKDSAMYLSEGLKPINPTKKHIRNNYFPKEVTIMGINNECGLNIIAKNEDKFYYFNGESKFATNLMNNYKVKSLDDLIWKKIYVFTENRSSDEIDAIQKDFNTQRWVN